MKEPWERGEPRIVCAALVMERKGIHYTFVGPRHGDVVMRRQYKAAGFEKHVGAVVGFIDQHGVFYGRKEAWKIAERNGQIIARCGGDDANGGTLYSENLY